MCLVVFAHNCHPQYPLLVAANRDEFHQRPTSASTFWPEHPQLLAGRDDQLGGTWMGITRDGRFAAVTNYRDHEAEPATTPASRGELPLNFLLGSLTPEAYLQNIGAQKYDYSGFNLLVGDGESLWYMSNASSSADSPRRLLPGLYGLSNAQLDTPWPKVETGKSRLQNLIAHNDVIDHAMLRETVASKTLAEADRLTPSALGQEMDRLLSAQFILSPEYGTRSSTTLWWDKSDNIGWEERSFNSGGEEIARTSEKFVYPRHQPDRG